mmetsp:Transcript_21123/g.35567  ORF Transcript_21123/g.35567 Transcript_21123/m.35567 type:complete len:127 (+) Transcript_21123:400-780(+)
MNTSGSENDGGDGGDGTYNGRDGVRQDFRKAFKWYRLAAKQGDPHAQFNLAVLHEAGHGCSRRNLEQAHKYFNRAALNRAGGGSEGVVSSSSSSLKGGNEEARQQAERVRAFILSEERRVQKNKRT